MEKKWQEISPHTTLSLQAFLEGLDYALTSTYFQYKNNYYQQVEGCAMGASISSVIAQLVLEDLENTIIPKLNYEIPFFYRYVDDCITLVPRDKTNYILELFNSYNSKLQFTIEIEDNNTLNFLDLSLIRTNNTINTQWFTKSTWSERYINFRSNHPISQKKSVVIGLADRAIALSDPEYRQDAIKKAKTALIKNNYPETFIKNIFKKRIHKFYNKNPSKTQTKTNNSQTNYIPIPYTKGLSEQLGKKFKKHDISICHKGNKLLKSNFSKLKAKTPPSKKTHVIYKIPCDNCDKVYIGQTSQHLEKRIQGHKYDKLNKTALTKHTQTMKHKFNFDKTEILATETHTKKREIIEMIEIKKHPNSINDKTDTQNLNKIYNNLLT